MSNWIMHCHCNMAMTLCVALLAGCSPKSDPLVGDYDHLLTAGYYIVCTSPDDVQVLHLIGGSWAAIPAKVTEIAWNDNFILGKQQELKPRADFPGDTMPIPVSGKFHYWIVDIGRTNQIATLSKEAFQEKVNTIALTNLTLRAINKIKWPSEKNDR